MTDGAFRLPLLLFIPGLIATLSAKAYSGRWHDAQLKVLSTERMGSKNNFLPKANLLVGSGSEDKNVIHPNMETKTENFNMLNRIVYDCKDR